MFLSDSKDSAAACTTMLLNVRHENSSRVEMLMSMLVVTETMYEDGMPMWCAASSMFVESLIRYQRKTDMSHE